MKIENSFRPIGCVESVLKTISDAPNFGNEGAPDAWLNINPAFAQGLDGIEVGDHIILLTWLHRSRRDRLKVHPMRDRNLPLKGVFATRSPDRPNPIGLHLVKVLEITGPRLKVTPLEAIDGTPLIDIKPIVAQWPDS